MELRWNRAQSTNMLKLVKFCFFTTCAGHRSLVGAFRRSLDLRTVAPTQTNASRAWQSLLDESLMEQQSSEAEAESHAAEARADPYPRSSGSYQIKDHKGNYYHIDEDGYFTTIPNKIGYFIDDGSGVRVRGGKYAGMYLYARWFNGCVRGTSKSPRKIKWTSGEQMKIRGKPVDLYNGYFYASRWWHEDRDYKFYKVDPYARTQSLPQLPATSTQQPRSPVRRSVGMGKVFVVYLTYPSASGDFPKKPARTKEQILDLICGTDQPSWAGVVKFSSWEQTLLGCSHVFVKEIASTVDPADWSRPEVYAVHKAWDVVKKMPDYQGSLDEATKKFGGHPTRFMMFIPATKSRAQAVRNGKESIFMCDHISWQTLAHEVGHNWGLDHADGFISYDTSTGTGDHFQKYADDALMGWQNVKRSADFTAVARFNLGWIPRDQVASFPAVSVATIRSLNEGPKKDGAYLIMIFPCPECAPGDPSNKHVGGVLYASFRVEDEGSPYGLEKTDVDLREHKSYKKLALIDRVHVHFQPTTAKDGRKGATTELWTTLKRGDTYKAPHAPIWIHVCFITAGARFGSAGIATSSISASDATGKCASGASNISGASSSIAKSGFLNGLSLSTVIFLWITASCAVVVIMLIIVYSLMTESPAAAEQQPTVADSN